MFVAREAEISRLELFLSRALNGQGGVCFITGEPGSGKTALTREFAHRAQARQADLIMATGECNAQVGTGEAYLPFREALGVLTGNVQASLAGAAAAQENAVRIHKILAKSCQILLEAAPELIGTLVPGASLVAKLGKIVADQMGLSGKIAELSRRKAAKATEPPSAQSAIEQEHIFEQYTNYLRTLSADHPLLLILDDLHWADTSSLGLLFHIGRRIAQSRILVVGTYRSEETLGTQNGAGHSLEKVQAELKRYFGEIIIPLDQENEAEAQRFVDACVDAEPNRLGYDFRQALRRHTAGTPLFVVELLRQMQAQGQLVKNAEGEWVEAAAVDWRTLPARVEGVIEQRLQRLDADSQETLAIGSVEGQTFTAEIISRLRATNASDLVRRLSNEMSRQHRLIEAAGVERLGSTRLSRYRFRHNLFQEYLYNELDEVQRSYYHEDVGNALETLYAGHLDDVAVQLAWHFEQAGLDEKAAHYHRRAADLAAQRYAHNEAIQHYGRALALTSENNLAARCELLLAREAALGWQGKRDLQAQDLEALATLADRLGDARTRAEVYLRRGEHARVTGCYDQALAFADSADATATAAGDQMVIARVHALRGGSLLQRGNYAEAQIWLDQALALAVQERAAPLAARAVYDLGIAAYYRGQYPAAEDRFNCALGMYDELGHARGQVNAWLMIGTVKDKQGDYVAARANMEHALELCRKIGWRHGEAYLLGNLGNTFFDLGRNAAARACHEQALAVCREIQDREGEAASLSTLGALRHRTGEPLAAIDLFRCALTIQTQIRHRRGAGYTLTHLGHALVAGKQLDAAEQAFAQALALRREINPESGLAIDDLAGQALVALAHDDPPRAAGLAQEALAWIEAHGEADIEYPAQVYLICYRALAAAADPAAAQAALIRGQGYLQAQAARIQDPDLRRSYLQEIPFNRELMEA